MGGGEAIEWKSHTEDLSNWVFISSNFLSFLICKMRLYYKSSKLLLSSNIPWLNRDLQLNLQKDWDSNYWPDKKNVILEQKLRQNL